jgi:hypothetical protein
MEKIIKGYFTFTAIYGAMFGMFQGMERIHERSAHVSPVDAGSIILCSAIENAVTFPFSWPHGFFEH